MGDRDRLEKIRARDDITGLDFVYVHLNQRALDVFLVHSLLPDGLRDSFTQSSPAPDQVRIESPSGGDAHSSVPVTSVKLEKRTVLLSSGAGSSERHVLRITTAFPGDFSRYHLRIDDDRIDPHFGEVEFTFKADCPSQLDCEVRPEACPRESPVDFPVDYQARDFWSFRRALLDFASTRYPDWQDRLEADVGVMLAELMSAVGDELAYYQDRVGREGYLETASQRRSLRRHARLVDYHVHDGLGASTWLDFTVKPGHVEEHVSAGAQIWEPGKRVYYEVGGGLRDTRQDFLVRHACNELKPYRWDDADTQLPAGAARLDVEGHHKQDLDLDDFSDPDHPGKWMLLRTAPVDASRMPRAWFVRVVEVTEAVDPVFGDELTTLIWEAAQATPYPLNLADLAVRGNVVPATAGKTHSKKRFTIGPEGGEPDLGEAVEREGPSGSVTYLFSLDDSDASNLVWLGEKPEDAQPELVLSDVTAGLGSGEPRKWDWRRSLLDGPSEKTDHHFTLDDGLWRRVVGYQRPGEEVVHSDYATGRGVTVRFGDSEFGAVPQVGTTFEVTYRLVDGRAGNLPAHSLTGFDPAVLQFVYAVTNPLAITNGIGPETHEQVRKLAPYAFRAVAYRAVRPEDYAEAAERLPWVQRAGASLRWTGAWLTAFVTPDPRGASTVTEAQRTEVRAQIDRFRQAGREARALDPVYANLDLRITICVEPFADRGHVQERVLEVLQGGLGGRSGFFSPDNFTFGTPLERPALEAEVQAVEGVRAVREVSLRRRGRFDWRAFTELEFAVGADEVVRVENDPSFPGRGSLELIMVGGA